MLWFALGMAGLWAASDWPLGTLGAGYLLSVHTVLYIIYTMVAAPLLVLGLPPWMAPTTARQGARLGRLPRGGTTMGSPWWC